MNIFSPMIQLQRHLRSSAISCVVPVLLVACAAFSTPSLPPDLHQEIVSVITLVFDDNHKNAEETAKRLIRKFPESPAGYFCMAFVLDSWMVKHQSDKDEDEFYRFCDLAIEKGEKELAQNNNNEWARFFIAGSDGFKGTFEARYERWITAFRLGWKGVSVLFDLEASGCEIPDIKYGIASYNYWRSAMMKMLWWMPGIEDKREESISALFNVCDKAIFTGGIASSTLIDVLLNEKRYSEALTLSEKQLRKYPKHIPFLWGKTRALIGLKQDDEAVVCLTSLIKKSVDITPNNHYMEVVYHSLLAKTYYGQKKYSLALAEYNQLENFDLDKSIRKRLEPIFAEMKGLKKQIVKELGSDRTN